MRPGLQREQLDDAPLDVQVEPVHHVVARDHLVAESRIAARERPHPLLEEALGFGARPLDGILEIAHLLMEPVPDLTHQPTPPVKNSPAPGILALREIVVRRPPAATFGRVDSRNDVEMTY